jgi:hypothetical protein
MGEQLDVDQGVVERIFNHVSGTQGCQTACNTDPQSASKSDPSLACGAGSLTLVFAEVCGVDVVLAPGDLRVLITDHSGVIR